MLEDRRAAFCARLKTLRESKGVTLEAIAASTKIGRSLLKGLEENDLSRWPQGIYRRAYVRDYLRAIDLLDESVIAEFARLFPDGASPCLDAPLHAPVVPRAEEPGALSLTLAEGRSERFARARTHIAAASIDLVVVLALSGVAWWVSGAGIWAIGALVSLAYYSLGTAALGRSAGSRLLEDHRWRRPPTTATADGIATPEPAMTGTGGLFGVLVVSIIRTLFLR